jgi:hypothetical protein
MAGSNAVAMYLAHTINRQLFRTPRPLGFSKMRCTAERNPQHQDHMHITTFQPVLNSTQHVQELGRECMVLYCTTHVYAYSNGAMSRRLCSIAQVQRISIRRRACEAAFLITVQY